MGRRPQTPKASGRWGPRSQIPVCDTFELHWLSENVSKVRYLHFSTITLSPLLLQNPGYVPTGKFLVTSLHVICGLGLPNQKFWLQLKIGDWLKTFLKTFFFGEHLRLCPWSLALTSSISVLGLERVCLGKGCPWPWPRIFFVFLALASSLVSSTPPLAIKTGYYDFFKFSIAKLILRKQQKFLNDVIAKIFQTFKQRVRQWQSCVLSQKVSKNLKFLRSNLSNNHFYSASGTRHHLQTKHIGEDVVLAPQLFAHICKTV